MGGSRPDDVRLSGTRPTPQPGSGSTKAALSHANGRSNPHQKGALSSIPAGEVRTYAWVAQQTGNPRARHKAVGVTVDHTTSHLAPRLFDQSDLVCLAIEVQRRVQIGADPSNRVLADQNLLIADFIRLQYLI